MQHRWIGALVAAWIAVPASAAPAKPVPPPGISISQGAVRLTVTALSDEVLRVRVGDAAAPEPEDSSWAVPAVRRRARAVVTPSANGFTTAKLAVSVDPATLALTVRDRRGQLILADAPGAYQRGSIDPADSGFTLRKAMPVGQHIFGMGDKTGGLDRAGKSFVNWNTDAYGFGSADDPIYKSIPFYIAAGAGQPAYGLLLDNTWRSGFDFGHRHPGTIEFGADGGQADYYILAGGSVAGVVRDYALLTGTAARPPRWALGYQQSRYSYMSSAEVRALVDRFHAEHFPLDVVWLDIDYQDHNRPFTVDRAVFPDFERMVGDLAARHVVTVPIVDLHIAAAPDEGYGPYDSGLAGNHFTHRRDGSLYVAPVWPGASVFPDFTNAATRAWWGELYAPLARAGVGGIWNDMNEPAVFQTPSKTMPLDNLHRVASDDFAPRLATHAEIHNVLGMENSRATFDGLLALRPAERPFVMTRASYAGGQRYAATWTGDNSATDDHLKLSVAQILNLGLSGFAWSGADVGGFTGGPTPRLLTDWFAIAAFTPVFRDHSAKGVPRAEPWVDGAEELAIRRRFVEERYRLLPFLDQLADLNARTGDPLMRPIFYDDEVMLASGCDASMSFTLGGRLLIAGNPKPGGEQPYTACLPPTAGWYDYWSGQKIPVGSQPKLTPTHGQLPLFVRAGSIIPRQPLVEHSRDTPVGPLEIHVYPGPECHGELYDDDGLSLAGAVRRQGLTCAETGDGKLRVGWDAPRGRYRPWWKSAIIIVHAADGERRHSVTGLNQAGAILVTGR